MDAEHCLYLTIEPTLTWLELDFKIRRTPAAERFLLAIAGQESAFQYRRQMGDGPARSWWQFERGGGVAGVLAHRSSATIAAQVCKALAVPPTAAAVHPAMEQNDILACAFARLLILTDPAPIPEGELAAYQVYLRCWRPGRPDSTRWPKVWKDADAAVTG